MHPQRSRRGRDHRLLPALTGLGLALVAGCEARATPAECTALLDRYVELHVRQEAPWAGEVELRREQEASRARAPANASFARCPQDMARSRVACAMAAPNVDEFEKCME